MSSRENLIIDMARLDHPEWAGQLRQQAVATMRCVLRGYAYSWLPAEQIVEWARALD